MFEKYADLPKTQHAVSCRKNEILLLSRTRVQRACSNKIVVENVKNRFVRSLHTCSRNTSIYETRHTRFDGAQKRRISRRKVKVMVVKNWLVLFFAHVFEKYVDFAEACN